MAGISPGAVAYGSDHFRQDLRGGSFKGTDVNSFRSMYKARETFLDPRLPSGISAVPRWIFCLHSIVAVQCAPGDASHRG